MEHITKNKKAKKKTWYDLIVYVTEVKKIGNSYYTRIPKNKADRVNIKSGSRVVNHTFVRKRAFDNEIDDDKEILLVTKKEALRIKRLLKEEDERLDKEIQNIEKESDNSFKI
jgi:antitoxin component of MazEF toxin-antitoxin module